MLTLLYSSYYLLFLRYIKTLLLVGKDSTLHNNRPFRIFNALLIFFFAIYYSNLNIALQIVLVRFIIVNNSSKSLLIYR